jgi:hypothetical protein
MADRERSAAVARPILTVGLSKVELGQTFWKIYERRGVRAVERALIQKVIDEARSEEANLVIWDKRDTFTVEQEAVADLEISDDHLRVMMQDGRATVYVELDSIYKLVVERERSRRSGSRTGFGAAGS